MSKPLENFALIGDGETAALVCRDGSIDWLCWPRFDSQACFAALLGSRENGCWSIAPSGKVTRTDRRYQDNTLVLETDFHTEAGAMRVTDFMPMRDGPSTVVRIVTALHGCVAATMHLGLRFDYGELPPWTEKTAKGLVARVGPHVVALQSPVEITLQGESATASFTVEPGAPLVFALRYAAAGQDTPGAVDADAALAATQRFWRDWIGRFDDTGVPYAAAVRRSLITLKAMVYRPSGGLVAAPTSSLPEEPGGKLNWDYRYCWLRDGSFTVSALLNAGFADEATRWRDWVLRAVAGSPGAMRIMYQVDGARHIPEWEVAALPGWRRASPVRIGNAASTQHQVDVYGELLHALETARQGGVPVTTQESEAVLRVADHLARVWDTAGSGIWESRGEQRAYVYSRAMAWVGLNGVAKRPGLDGATAQRFAALSERIHAEVLDEGWNGGLGSFTAYYGGQSLDASVLLLPVNGFLPADDPRMASTIEAIGRELSQGGLIRRKKAKADGPDEGAFLACSCWMADCLRLQGKRDEAAAQLERVLAVANDVGLLAEEYDVPGRHQTGNFPQALTHLGVVNSAIGLG